MIENASRKGAGALKKMIGSENDHHDTMIRGRGQERTEISRVKHTNHQAEEGSNGLVLKTSPTH